MSEITREELDIWAKHSREIEQLGSPIITMDRESFDRLIAAARRSLVDDEPITAEWLRGQGFELSSEGMGAWQRKRINEWLSVYHYIEGETSTIDDNEMGTEIVMHNIAARGQLTKLIEALGGAT